MNKELQNLADRWVAEAKEIDVGDEYPGSSEEFAAIQAKVDCLYACAGSLKSILNVTPNTE